MPVNDLPEILELKQSLDGRRKEFRCRLLHRDSTSAVVLFVSATAYDVAGLVLPPGTVTFGHFWTDRAYNVYHWLTPAGATVGLYFNVADRVEIDDAGLRWRDLAVDVLVTGGRVRVLDEDELPPGLAPELRSHIQAATRDLVERAPLLQAELESAATALWPRAFGGPRP